MSNPEDSVVSAIDALERDEIDELVDWQLSESPAAKAERGRFGGDAWWSDGTRSSWTTAHDPTLGLPGWIAEMDCRVEVIEEWGNPCRRVRVWDQGFDLIWSGSLTDLAEARIAMTAGDGVAYVTSEAIGPADFYERRSRRRLAINVE